jgi:hypothetical protein
VVFNTSTGEIHAQSRNRILTVDNDNNGFALWVKANENHFREKFKMFMTDRTYVVLFGEWAGPGVQAGVGVSQIEHKMFFPFAIMFANDNDDKSFGSIDVLSHFNNGKDIYSVDTFGTWTAVIDFENPQSIQNQIIEYTEVVEAECPVAKYFGISNGVGEGIVWTTGHMSYIFKVKGEKHSVSKVKTLAPVDIEKIEKVQGFVSYALTEARLRQGIEFLREMNHPIDVKSTPHFLRWIVGDVMKEEADTIVGNNLESKDVNKEISTQARKWFFDVGLSEE